MLNAFIALVVQSLALTKVKHFLLNQQGVHNFETDKLYGIPFRAFWEDPVFEEAEPQIVEEPTCQQVSLTINKKRLPRLQRERFM